MSDSAPPGLMIVHAHPDDECVSSAGTFLRYADEGTRICGMVYLTRHDGPFVLQAEEIASGAASSGIVASPQPTPVSPWCTSPCSDRCSS